MFDIFFSNTQASCLISPARKIFHSQKLILISVCTFQDSGESIPSHGGLTDKMDSHVSTLNLTCFQNCKGLLVVNFYELNLPASVLLVHALFHFRRQLMLTQT